MNDRCSLCLGGLPQASHVLFQVLPGVTERLRYSLPTHLLCFQYILSYKLCKGVYPQVFRAIFQVLAGVTEGLKYTAISRKVVGKSARDNPERYCGWFLVHCSSKKFERMALETMGICLRVRKESNKSRFDSYSIRNNVLLISHITFRDCRVHIFSDTFLEIAVVSQLVLCGPNVTIATSCVWVVLPESF